MFKKNTRHLQIPLTSHIDELPERLRNRLQNSWAGTFYGEFFCRLDEQPFEVLYADFPSRPNVPVNVLVGLEFLKAANGWTDEEMYDHFCYDVQVRYALGYRQLGEGYFDLRTVYNFRERLAHHMQKTGENLLDQAFEQVTDGQLQAFALKTGKQRTDSTQLASNIRQMGRVQLLVTVLQRVHRMLTEADRQRYADLFAAYLKGHAGQYVYHLKSEELPVHLERIGKDMQRLLCELRDDYQEEAVYQVLARVFTEHFRQEQEQLLVKTGEELSAGSLQSPDDLEATYREKRGKGYRGYVANLTETCDPKNPVQLITKVQVTPNKVDDSQLLADAIPNLKERMQVETMFADGGYGSPHTDEVLHKHQITLIQTAIRGRQPAPDKLHLEDFIFHLGEQGTPTKVTCPQGKSVAVHNTNRPKAFVAHFEIKDCQACPLLDRCPAQPGKRDARHHLRFTKEEVYRAQRRRNSREYQKAGHNLRAAVESTVRSVKHPFPAGKLPVRGRFRVTCMVIASAAVTNVRRLHRYLQAKNKENQDENKGKRGENKGETAQNHLPKQEKATLFSFVLALQHAFRALFSPYRLKFGW